MLSLKLIWSLMVSVKFYKKIPFIIALHKFKSDFLSVKYKIYQPYIEERKGGDLLEILLPITKIICLNSEPYN